MTEAGIIAIIERAFRAHAVENASRLRDLAQAIATLHFRLTGCEIVLEDHGMMSPEKLRGIADRIVERSKSMTATTEAQTEGTDEVSDNG